MKHIFLFLWLLIFTYPCFAVIQPMQFPHITYEQANPFWYGMQQGTQIQYQMQRNRQIYLQNQMLQLQIEQQKQLINQQQFEQSQQVQKPNIQQQQSSEPWLVVYSQTKPHKFLGVLGFLIKKIHGTGYFTNAKEADSIYNHSGYFGSPTSDFSVCNEKANWPPAIVDDNSGKFYGLLTLNNDLPNRIKDKAIVAWLQNEVCSE